MGEHEPIEVGALYSFTEQSNYSGTFRVLNIVLEEQDANVSVEYDEEALDSGISNAKESVVYSDIRLNESEGLVKRINSGHEAWEWRQ